MRAIQRPLLARLWGVARWRGAALVLGCLLLAACQGSSESRLEEVRALQDAGAFAESEDTLRDLLAQQPDHPEASYRLGLALLRTGRPSQALWPLGKAAHSEDFAREAGVLLASTQFALRNFEAAIEAATAVLAVDPDNEQALLTRTYAANGLNQSEAALADADRMLLLEPENLDALSARATALTNLERIDEAEQAFEQLERVAARADVGAASRPCLALALFYGKLRKDAERAVAQTEKCLDRFPDDPAALGIALQIYDGLQLGDQATALLRKTVDENPEDLIPRVALSQRLLAAGQNEDAVALLREGAEMLASAPAWRALAALLRRTNDLEGAREAFQNALTTGDPKDETLSLELADVLVDLDRLAEAERIAANLQESVYRDLILGRVALARGEHGRALGLLEKAIQQWPNNAGARMAAAEAAYALGDIERSMTELREASRIAPRDSDAALLLARLSLARGEYDAALGFASRHMNYQGLQRPDAHLIAARANALAGHPDRARAVLGALAAREEYRALAFAELAKLTLAESGLEAAVSELEQRGLDMSAAGSEVALAQLTELRLQAGRGEQARAEVEALVESRPESPSLRALLGLILVRTDDLEAAAEALKIALDLDPEYAGTLSAMGVLATAEGRPADAVAWFDRAAAIDPDNPDHSYRAAQLVGDPSEAEKRLRELLRTHPEHAGAANDLAWLLAQRGESLDLAAKLAEQATRSIPVAETIDTLGYVRLARGELDGAIEAFRAALGQRPDYATARYHLGLALAKQGDLDSAREAFRTALASGPFPESQATRSELRRLGESEEVKP